MKSGSDFTRAAINCIHLAAGLSDLLEAGDKKTQPQPVVGRSLGSINSETSTIFTKLFIFFCLKAYKKCYSKPKIFKTLHMYSTRNK